eukprot:1145300-Pelagomonas_calceolata.AAC.1
MNCPRPSGHEVWKGDWDRGGKEHWLSTTKKVPPQGLEPWSRGISTRSSLRAAYTDHLYDSGS